MRRVFIKLTQKSCRNSSMNSRILSKSKSSTVNSPELEKFSVVGDEWWDEKSVMGTGPLHAMNPIRINYIREKLSKQLDRYDKFDAINQIRGLKILDVGCGGGLAAEALARLGAQVTAIDPSPENIHVARKHSSRDPLTSTIDYRVNTIEEIVETNMKFDAVCALEVIEHVDNVELFLNSCSKVLKDDGSFFLSTINRTPISYAVAIVAAERILKLLPNNTHDYNKFLTPEEIRTKCSHTNIYIANICGMVFQPLKSLSLLNGSSLGINGISSLSNNSDNWRMDEADTSVNYITHGVKHSKSQQY